MSSHMVAAAAMVLLGAGCLDAGAPATSDEHVSGSPPDDTPSPTGPSEDPWPSEPPLQPVPPVFRQYGCQSFYSHHVVPESYAREQLPPGFEPYAPAGTSGALFTSKLWRCERSLLGDAPVDANAFLLYYLATVPPAPFQGPNVTFYWYPLEVISETQVGADVFRSWTIGAAVDGALEFRHLGTDPAPAVSATAQSPNSTVDFAAILNPPSTGPQGAVRYFGGVDGGVTAGVDIVVHEGLRATSQLSLLRIDGPRSPWTTWDRGTSEYQGWGTDDLSYTWTYVDLAGPP